jgi:pyruvate dehydrogenase E2 component (dihydrolipoamide acetyltransferase)
MNYPERSAMPVASPRAKRVAAELGVDWTALTGSGSGGRIREADVRSANTNQTVAGRLSPRRKAIAEHLRRSRERTVPVTLTTIADAGNLVAIRKQLKVVQHAVVPTYGDIVAKIVATVLKSHPNLAVLWSHDGQSLISQADRDIDIAFAVDTPDGLLAPVIRDVGSKSLAEVAKESARLIERARAGNLTVAELQGGVLTVTNLGSFGIDAFTPVIHYPQIAILGIGAIRRKPAVTADGTIAARDQITLSLTFDHAAIDGAQAAAFLRDIVVNMEQFRP